MTPESIKATGTRSKQFRPYIISVAAAIIVPALLFAIVAWQEYKNVIREMEKEVLRSTEIFQQHALNVFKSQQLIAEAVNTSINGMSWDEIGRSHTVHDYLGKLARQYPQVQAIWLADASGVVRNASLPLPAEPVNVAERDYFKSLRQADNGMFIGHIVEAKVMKGLNFNMACRRQAKSGAFDGVVILTVFPEYFSNFWNKAMSTQDAATALLRGDGMVLARAPQIVPGILQLPPESASARAIRSAVAGTYRGISANDKAERIFAFRKLDQFNVYVVHGINVNSARHEWYADLRLFGALFGAASIALLILAITALHRAREEQLAVHRWQETAEQLVAKSAELESTAQRLQLATKSGQLGVWEWDITAGTIIWDERMFDLYGLSQTSGAVELAVWINGVHPDDRARAMAAVESALAGEKQFDTEFRLVQTGGLVRHIKADGLVIRDADGNALRMIGINSDFTERKLMEAELTEGRERLEELVRTRTKELSEALEAMQQEIAQRQRVEAERSYLAAIVENSGDAIVGKSLQGVIESWNKGAERLYGYRNEEVRGRQISLLLPADRNKEMDYILDSIRQGEAIKQLETVRLHKDGSQIDVALTVSPIFDSDGRIVGASSIARDISSQKKAEAELHKLHAELEQRINERTAALSSRSRELADSQQALLNLVDDLNLKTAELELANAKLKEVDRLKSMFIASMSHELRTPLNSIIGFSSILHDEWTGTVNAKQKENLAIILRNGNHLLSLINDVIDVSKVEAGRIELVAEEFDLHELIDEAVTVIKKDLEAKGLALQVAAVHQQMHTDRRLLLQCVLNLLSNAIKYTPQGEVSVSVNITSAAGSSKDRAFAEICVTDTGLGISETDMAKMFQPFVRLVSPLQATIPGTGLGLYLTRKLVVETLKGDLQLTSEFGKGSKFTLRIPVRLI